MSLLESTQHISSVVIRGAFSIPGTRSRYVKWFERSNWFRRKVRCTYNSSALVDIESRTVIGVWPCYVKEEGDWAGSRRIYMHLAILLINPKGLLAPRIFIFTVGGGNKTARTNKDGWWHKLWERFKRLLGIASAVTYANIPSPTGKGVNSEGFPWQPYMERSDVNLIIVSFSWSTCGGLEVTQGRRNF